MKKNLVKKGGAAGLDDFLSEGDSLDTDQINSLFGRPDPVSFIEHEEDEIDLKKMMTKLMKSILLLQKVFLLMTLSECT